MAKDIEKFYSALCLPLIELCKSHVKDSHQDSGQPPKASPFWGQSHFLSGAPFSQETHIPSHSVQSCVDISIIQFKTDSTKINSAF